MRYDVGTKWIWDKKKVEKVYSYLVNRNTGIITIIGREQR
jgi:hypothetical protein